MARNERFTICMHRKADSIFGGLISPVIRNGSMLTFDDARRAAAECACLNAGSGDPYARYSVERVDSRSPLEVPSSPA
jgi:hypothetical protein